MDDLCDKIYARGKLKHSTDVVHITSKKKHSTCNTRGYHKRRSAQHKSLMYWTFTHYQSHALLCPKHLTTHSCKTFFAVLDVSTGEEARSACCKCIPGAPGFDESDELRNPTEGWGDAIARDWSGLVDAVRMAYPVLLNSTSVKKQAKPAAEAAAATQPQHDMPVDAIPVVSAVPIEEAPPIDAVQGTDSQPAEGQPSEASPGETPATTRRLLAVFKKVYKPIKGAVPRLRMTSMAAIQVSIRLFLFGLVSMYVCRSNRTQLRGAL